MGSATRHRLQRAVAGRPARGAAARGLGGGGQQLQEAGQGPSTRRWRISRGCRRLPRESAGEDEGAQRQEGGVRQGLSMADRVQGLSMADRVLGSATHPRGRWNPTAEGASGSMRRPGRWRLCAATGRRAWAGSWPRRRYETRQELGRRLRSSTRRWSGRLRRSRTSLTKVARGAESERLGQHAGGGAGKGQAALWIGGAIWHPAPHLRRRWRSRARRGRVGTRSGRRRAERR